MTTDTQEEPGDVPDQPVSPPTVRAADALYQPFPDFIGFRGGSRRAIDQETLDRSKEELLRARETHTEKEYQHALEMALRAAAIDTGAVEGRYDVDYGFTMTVATQEVDWQEVIDRQERDTGRPIRGLFEGQLAAYLLARQVGADREQPVTEAWVRAVHVQVTEGQDVYRAQVEGPDGPAWQEVPLPKGQDKTQPNHVVQAEGTVFAYAPVNQTPHEMYCLVQELRTKAFREAHPILQAAYVHYAFIRIHPFADGNGRTARVLASVFLLREEGLPFVLLESRRREHVEALREADTGRYRAFVEFVFDRMLDTLQFVTGHLGSEPVDELESLQMTLEPRMGFACRTFGRKRPMISTSGWTSGSKGK
jgi:Fic family protein